MAKGKYSILLILAVTVITVSGCVSDQPTGSGTLEILVSDEANNISSFEFLNVNLEKIRVFRTNASYEEFTPAVTGFDLTKLQGEDALSLINATLDEGKYTKIEFYVSGIEGNTSEGAADVKVPSGKLMITSNFEIISNSTVSFVFDIGVVRKGQTNEYNIQPVISESGVVGRDVESVIRVSGERAKKHESQGTGSAAGLTIQQAIALAQGTECTEKGSLEDDYSYNENSKTWWIGLDMNPEYENELCNPACVVSEDDSSVEINWRCTGLLPPEGEGA